MTETPHAPILQAGSRLCVCGLLDNDPIHTSSPQAESRTEAWTAVWEHLGPGTDDDGASRHIAYDLGKDGESLVEATLHRDGSMSYDVVWLDAGSPEEEQP